jgi:hypothetical protein
MRKNFLEHLKGTKETWFEWFHTIYATVVIVTAAVAIFKPSTPKEIVLLMFFGLYFAILLGFLVFLTHTYSKKSRHAEAQKYLHGAIHIARDAYRYLDTCYSQPETYREEKFRDYLVSTLTAAEAAFSLVTGGGCRTSIKVLSQDKDESLYVKTLARDNVSMSRYDYKDDNEGKKHKIMGSTAFQAIIQGRVNYYFNNNLMKTVGYFNTSMVGYEEGGYKTQDFLAENWPLPYVSTIVWPIRATYKKVEGGTAIPEGSDVPQYIYGFLTVDSAYTEVFDRRYDSHMGAALADALFAVMDMYGKVNKEIEKNSAPPSEGT